MAEDVLDRLYEPFFSTKERGMGLGLTLAARIMEQHHGRLELLANGEGGGAFAFSLPAAAKAS
jgi:C4-dicarboxylate-specific signal transduction histidine kinase